MSGEILVTPTNGAWCLEAAGHRFPCAIGRGGVSGAKREGDGATPLGSFALRELLFRPDRGAVPRTALPMRPLSPAMGWCDCPADPAYNRAVTLPWRSSAEHLWRRDGLYDLIVPLGYNDAPVSPAAGSAIFLHVARAGLTPTEGCVALHRSDLLKLLSILTADWRLTVRAAGG